MFSFNKKTNENSMKLVGESLIETLITTDKLFMINIKEDTYCCKYHTMNEIYNKNKKYFNEKYQNIINVLVSLNHKQNDNY